MAYPTTKIEISFAAADGPYTPSPTWTDVTAYVREINMTRGRTTYSETFPSGSAQVTLDNRDARFTPWNTSSPYYGTGTSLVPRRQIQITANAGAGYVPVYRGFVSGWPVDYTDAGKDTTVTISCFDLQGLIADTQITKDWADEYIQNLNPLHYWKFNEPIAIPASPPTIANYGSSTQTLTPQGIGFSQGSPLASGFSYGSGYSPSPSSQYWRYQLTNATLPNGDVSCSMWRQAPATPSVTTIADFSLRDYRFVLAYSWTNLRFEYTLYTAANSFLYASTTMTWDTTVPHHVAFIYDFGISQTWYIDTNVLTFGFISTTAATYNNVDQFTSWNGSIQNVALWSTAITPAQVTDIYNYSVAYISETSSARIQRLLNKTELNASQYSITASPVVTVAEIEVGGSVLPQLQQTVNSESGDMFVTKAGVLTFTNQNYDYTQGSGGTATAATFTDTGTNLSYGTEISIDYSGDDIINTVTVQFSNGGTTTSTASSSVTTNGRAQSTIDTYISTVSQASDLATLLSQTQSVVKPRFSPFDISSNFSNASWQTILGLELLSKISLTRTPSTGSAITSVLLVDSIEHQIKPMQWETRLTGSAQNTGWFVLDSSLLDGVDLLL